MDYRVYEPLDITREQALRLAPGMIIQSGGHEWTVDQQTTGTDEQWRAYVTVIAVRPYFVTFPGSDFVTENARWARFHNARWFDRHS